MTDYEIEITTLTQSKGNGFIGKLKEPQKKNMVRSEGGDGFMYRHPSNGWRKVPTGYESLNDVEDLQDRMNIVIQSCTMITLNQRGLASSIARLNHKPDTMDARILAIAFNEAEITLK